MRKIFSIFVVITLTYVDSGVLQGNATISTEQTNTTQDFNKNVVAEGGLIKNAVHSLPPQGREGYTRMPAVVSTKSITIPIFESRRTSSPLENVNNSTTEKSDHKSIGRKGVDFNENKPNNNTVRPKKPTVTTHGDEPFAPSHFESSKSNASVKTVPKVPNVDILTSQDNTQKYIVPIIIVILSVPFVAILISIVYKRGSEWWRYRHYRRMDFLINGMYDN